MSRTYRRNKRTTYGKIRDAHGMLIDRDTLEHEALLYVHGESQSGKAYLVSRDGYRAHAVFVPKALLDVSDDPCGGVERLDGSRVRQVVTIFPVSGPGFLFDEKGLR